MEDSLHNGQIAELLASEGDRAEGHLRRAYYQAAHGAFMWAEETSDLIERGEPLTGLRGVGPFMARKIMEWQEAGIRPGAAAETRRNFLTLTQARSILAQVAGYRDGLRGDLQMHTTWSDGAGSVAEMATAAAQRGYDYISITDHTKGLKIAGGIDERELERQAEEIQTANKTAAVRIWRSAEVNLSPAGEVDMEAGALAGLDVVLGSFHSQLRKTEDQTERYLAALRNPLIQILGHPRGRVYNYRLGLKADWHRVFAEAARLGKAVEIDAYSDRQDLDVALLQVAREEGVMLSLGTDAHHPEQLGFIELGLGAAALAGIPKEQILNYKTAEELMEWVAAARTEPGRKKKALPRDRKRKRKRVGASLKA